MSSKARVNSGVSNKGGRNDRRNSHQASGIYSSRMSVTSSRIGISSSRFGISSSRFGMTASQMGLPSRTKLNKKPTKSSMKIFDEDGVDVTPKNLLSSTIKAAAGHVTENVDSKSQMANFYDSKAFGVPPELSQSRFGGASTYQASYAAGLNQSIMMSSAMVSRASLDSVTSEISNHGSPTRANYVTDDVPTDERVPLTHADLKKVVAITISETDTIPLFELESICALEGDEDFETVKENNARYEKLCSIKEGNDMYRGRGVQTFSDAMKSKEMQTTEVRFKDTGTLVTTYDIYDTYNAEVQTRNDEEQDEELGAPTNVVGAAASFDIISSDRAGVINQTTLGSVSGVNSGSNLITPQASGSPPPAPDSSNPGINEELMERIAALDSFKEALFIMEQAVVQNIYHPKQRLYRGHNEIKFLGDNDGIYDAYVDMQMVSKIGPNLSRVWAYECAATRGLPVTCMTWNENNNDLVAVGYSQYAFSTLGKGMVCVWSIKNPEHPDRMFEPPCAVTSVCFSNDRPNLLAVGLLDGNILLYNVRSSKNHVILDTTESPGRHTAPVWEVKWVKRDRGTGEEMEEVLVSAAGDGRVTQWTLVKGFEFCDLMKVKRISKQNAQKRPGGAPTKKSDAFISRFAPIMCFSFHSVDPNIYLVGTEEGAVHKCLCSYNEQFLETYLGHKGPIYRVYWAPFDPEIFLTSSADWHIKLWHISKTSPILTFLSSSKAVIDIDWSPFSATLFAAIRENQIEIWDLSISILDPVIVHARVSKIAMTSVKFAQNARALLVGDYDGQVTVFQLADMLICSDDQGDKLKKIYEATLPNDPTSDN